MTPAKRLLWAGVALTGLGSVASGQSLGLPGGTSALGGLGGAPSAFPALPGAATPAVAAVPTAATGGGGSIWSFLGLSKSNLAACKQQICASQLGQMLNSGLTPLSGLTGGMIPTFCPTTPSAAQAAALAAAAGPTSAQAVAAKIQQDEAEAKARRAAVRYLATVDCHYWPEAEAAIIGALRDDRNECVRYEAALALLNGCCCTAKTIEALKIVVSGSEKDGKPSETSERVRGVSMTALDGCLMRFHPTPPPTIPLERPEPASGTFPVSRAANLESQLTPAMRRVAYYYVTLRDVPATLIASEARRTVDRLKAGSASAPSTLIATGNRSVFGALARAAIPKPATTLTPTPAPTPPPSPVPPIVSESPDLTPAPPVATPAPTTPPPIAPAPPPPLVTSEVKTTARTVKAVRPSGEVASRGGRNLRDIFLNSTSHAK